MAPAALLRMMSAEGSRQAGTLAAKRERWGHDEPLNKIRDDAIAEITDGLNHRAVSPRIPGALMFNRWGRRTEPKAGCHLLTFHLVVFDEFWSRV